MPATLSVEEFQVLALGQLGGYSHKAIAWYVYGSEETYVETVRRILYKNRVLVTDWRNMVTPESMGYADQVAKPKGRKTA